MKRFFFVWPVIVCVLCGTAFGVGMVTNGSVVSKTYNKNKVENDNESRSLNTLTNVNSANYNSNPDLRGTQGAINAYKQNQRNNYYLVNVPDVDTACRQKIYNCLTDYCGDVTILPGQRNSRCAYATESELYNYALLCLQKDTSILLPQYNTNNKMGIGGLNTAAHLCPSYVQQELMSFLSMSNMAEQLTKAHSSQCLERRQELEAAMSCHSVALAYGNQTTSMLTSQLTDFCGAGVSGGSAEMVTRFANAGNVGANVWGWAEKIVTLDMNRKGADWQAAVDSVLASYTNRMNLACGDNMQLNLASYSSNAGQPTALQAVATAAVASAANNGIGILGGGVTTGSTGVNQPTDLYMEITSATEVYSYDDAYQVVSAGIYNSPLTQNAFLTSLQMQEMQNAYKRGTKVFVLRDSTRCYIIKAAELTSAETSALARSLVGCISK